MTSKDQWQPQPEPHGPDERLESAPFFLPESELDEESDFPDPSELAELSVLPEELSVLVDFDESDDELEEDELEDDPPLL